MRDRHDRPLLPAAVADPARRRRLLDALLVLAVWIPYALLVQRFWFVTDDAYITFRYARNLALGQGPRFNLGEEPPVEGYSNFLWMLVCSGFERLGLNVELWPLLLSSACGALLLWLVFRTVVDRLGCSRWIGVCAAWLVALHPPFAVWATSGLETMAFALLLFVAVERWILRADGIEPVSAGLAALGLSLVRVEGVLWALATAALALLSRRLAGERAGGAWLRAVGGLVAGYGAYEVWRYSYYGAFLANTAAVKGGIDAYTLARGFDYVAMQWLTQLDLWVTLPAALVALRRGRIALGLPLVAITLAFYAWAVLVGGDFMAMGRFVVPAWPLTALLFAWWLRDVAGAGTVLRRAAAVSIAAGALVLAALPAIPFHLVPREVRRSFDFRGERSRAQHIDEFEYWRFQRDDTRRLAVKGRAMKRWLDPDARVVLSGIGAVGYYSALSLLDQHGLVSREAARADYREFWALRGRTKTAPGHDRLVPPSFFYRFDPEVVLVQHLRLVEGEPRERGREFQRAAFPDVLSGLERGLRQAGLGERYVVDFRPIPDWEYGGPDQYLVYWRRMEEGAAPQQEWQAFEARLEGLRAGRDPFREVEEQGYPRPLAGWWSKARGAGRSVVLIVVDTLRADHVGCYGASRDTTRNLDRLAAEGVRFERAYSSAPWTMPSVASILSGLHPSTHGLRGFLDGLPDRVTTLAEILQQHGYATGAVISHRLLGRRFNFSQGFDLYFERHARGQHHVSSDGVTEDALHVVDRLSRESRPFFLLVHYFDPHWVYLSHPEFGLAAPPPVRRERGESLGELRRRLPDLAPEELQRLRDLYDEEVLFTDAAIGRLFEGLRERGLYQDAVIVVTADHGEEFAERGWLGHSTSLYEEVVRVPLILRASALADAAGRSIPWPVSSASLAPTLLELAGVEAPGTGFEGVSVAGWARQAPARVGEVLVEVDQDPLPQAVAERKAHKKALIRGEHKLIRDDESGRLELYDLARDPRELEDLSGSRPGLVAELRAELEWRLREARARGGRPLAVPERPDDVEQLRALGYVDDPR